MDFGLFEKEKEMTQTTLFQEAITETRSTSSNLDQGYAHEPLCVGMLLRMGFKATQLHGQDSGDVWLKHNKHLCVINVKTSEDIKNGMVRGSVCKGRYEKTKYSEDEVDIIAFFYTDSIWPLFFHIIQEERKHVSVEPKMFTEEMSKKTFDIAFAIFKERLCP